MEKYISKFITYLNTKLNQEQKLLDEDDNLERAIMISYYEEMLRYFNTVPMPSNIFTNFNIFSNLISESSLNSIEKTNLLFYVLKRNIELGILTTTRPILNITNILKYNFKTISLSDFLELIHDPNFSTFINSPDELLDKKTLKIRDEIRECIIEFNDTPKIIIEHLTFLKYYIENQNITKEDISILLKSLEQLEIDERLIKTVEYILNKKFTKVEEPKFIEKTNKESKPKENNIATKEYNEIYRELQKKFDFYHMKINEILTPDEIIHYVSLMMKIKIDPIKINTFIKISNKEFIKNNNNPTELYNELFPKIYHYIDLEGMKEQISYIEDCLYNMYMEEDYEEWEELLKSEINNTINKLPKDYEYELTLAKKKLN